MENFNQYNNQQPNIRRYIAMAIVLLCIVILGYFLFTYTIVQITVSSKTSKGIILSSKTLTDSPNASVKLIASLQSGQDKTMLVRRGSYEYAAKSENENTTKSVKLHAFTINSVDLALAPQKYTQKIGSDGLDCSVTVESVVYSYGCFKQSNVFRHTPLSRSSFSQKVPLFGEDFQQKLSKAYRSGLLISSEEGIDDSYGALISYQDLKTQTKIPITLPTEYLKGLDEGQDVVHNIICDSDTENPRFGLVLYDDSILIYDSITDKDPIQIYPSIDKTGVAKESLIVSYQLAGANLISYVGRSGSPTDSKKEQKVDQQYKQGFVYVYNTADPSGDPLKTIVIPKSIRSSAIQILNNNSLVLQTETGIRVFEIKDDEKVGNEILRAPASDTLLINKNSQILYANDSKIYSFDPKKAQSNLVFESSLIKFSSFSAGKEISFNAYTMNNNSSQTMQVYTLDINKNSSSPRLETILPYQQSYLPIIQMDYSGNLIVIKPSLDSLEFIGIPVPTYDQAEYQRKTKQITDQLDKDGITSNKYTIVFII